MTEVADPVVVHGDLVDVLEHADSGVLLAILVLLTGDRVLFDRYVGQVEHTFNAPEWRGRAHAEVHTEIARRLVLVLADRGLRGPVRDEAIDPRAWNDDLLRRLFGVALGQDVLPEYVPLLLEQGGFQDPQPVVPRTRPIPTDTRVAILGAGLGGISGALYAQRAGLDYVIYDRHEDLGGTWLVHRYPGVGVDTASAYYSLSTHLNPEWTSYYPKGGEYREYLSALADREGIREHIRFGTEVEGLRWDEEEQLWRIALRTGDGERREETASFVITAAGFLNRPKYPEWEGRETFDGISVHSGEWDPDIDLRGKRVALVGTGCTAAQIVDAVADDVAHLTVFQRQAHWVAPRKRPSDDVPAIDRRLLAELPFYAQFRRIKSFWGAADNAFPVVTVDPEWARTHKSISPANDVLLRECVAYIERTFGAGTELAAKLTPDFPPFAKRIIRDPGRYYSSLALPKVEVDDEPVRRVVPEGIVDARGELIPVDVIVYATGFTLDYLATMDIYGRNGRSLIEEWAGNPRAYRGGMVPGFPNLFITSGPNQGAAHGAGHNLSIEVLHHYTFETIQLLAERGGRTIEVSRQAYDAYVERIDADMAKTIWGNTPQTNTYYRNAAGRVVVASPWRIVDYWAEHRAPVEADLLIDGVSTGSRLAEGA